MARKRRRRPRRTGGFLQIPTSPPHMAPADAVRWLLDFAGFDIAALSDAEIQVTVERALAFMGGHGDESLGPRARRTLADWQAVVRNRLRCYFTASGWRFEVALAGSVFGPRGDTGQVALLEEPGGSYPEVFSWYALQAILQLGEHFRRCQNEACGKPFVARGRMAYCSAPCGNRVRVARFRNALKDDKKRKAEMLKQRRALYAKKIKEKLGAAVKVGKRGVN